MLTVICHTSGCENEDVPIEIPSSSVDPFTGKDVPVVRVECGPCRTEITDVTPPISGGES